MSIIQNIRDKYARVAVIAIAAALLGFTLMDYVKSKNRGGPGGRSNSVGSINGHTINDDEFAKVVDQTEANMKQQGYPDNPAMKQQAVDQAWSQEINLAILKDQFDKLGMQIGKKERGDILYGPDAPEDIKKAGTDENGNYDPMRAKQQVDQMMKNKQVPKEQKERFNQYIVDLEQQRKAEKYFALFTNSTNYPRWFVEKQTTDNSMLAKISMVRMLYSDSTFVDSSIKVSDKEIADYISKHKDNFKQEESRSIHYVVFSAAPTAADSMAIKNQVVALKPELDTTGDVGTFLARNGNTEPFDDYKNASQLPAAAKDSITHLARGRVFGPYLDGNDYVLAKLIDFIPMPDSVKARHILIQTYDPQQQKQLLDDSTAKKRIDSIEAAIKGGSRFDSLAVKFSDDKGSGAKGGLLSNPNNPATDYFTNGQMVKEFNDFSFEGKKGDKKIVKTIFGYHLIEILDQKNFEPHYKVAYLSQEVVASQETDGNALQEANNFSGDVKNPKSFDEVFDKNYKAKGYTKGSAENIQRIDGQVRGSGLGFSRQFVRNIYAAKAGEVLKPEAINIGNYKIYVVAVVTEVLSEGTQSAAKARFAVEPIIRKKKKAEMLKQKIGKVTTLEAAASILSKPIETIDSLRMDSRSPSPKLGFEPRVIGASFNPDNKGKVVPEALEGNNGVYVVKVENISATSAMNGSVADQRKQKYEQGKQANNPLDALKKAATIKDKRADKY